MDFRFSAFDPEALAKDELLQRLAHLFRELLLRTAGDVGDALGWLDELAQRHGLWRHGLDREAFERWLKQKEQIAGGPGGTLRLTHSGTRALRRESLEAVFSSLERDVGGEHRVAAPGPGLERLPETRPWAFGDTLDALDANATLRNALMNTFARGSSELEIREDDLEVHETEHLSSCASVLLIDISHSMVLYGEDRISPARKVALALVEMIRTRFPKDRVFVATFGDEAREVAIEDLPYLDVGPFHTNTRGALRLARELLRKERRANRQIFMVTDGKPSALTERNGTIYKNPFGLDRRIVARTLDEASACRRDGIQLSTFMLTSDPTLVGFVEEMTAAAHGRAYFSRPDDLGSFLFVDYIKNRRRHVR